MYQYKNDCLIASVEYKKDYYEDRDIKPDESYSLNYQLYRLRNKYTELEKIMFKKIFISILMLYFHHQTYCLTQTYL